MDQATPGPTSATLKDVALLAEVSTATASHVINGTRKVRDETRDRVFAAIETLGYAGHSIARSLRRGRTAMLGLVVSVIQNPFFAMLAGQVQRAAASRGFQVIFANSEERGDREREIVEALAAQRVDGIILAPVARENVRYLLNRRIPLTVVNRRFPEIDTPYVIVDDHRGAWLGFDHLWQLGHRRIAVVHGDRRWSTTVERIAGARDAAKRNGVSLDDTLLFDAGGADADGETRLAERLHRARRPTAVLALNNSALLAAIRALHQSLLRCPDDVSLVGYGITGPYWIPYASISMVEQPVAEMADAAVRLLLSQSEKERGASVILPPTLMAGQSSGPLASAATRRKRAAYA
jgi:LacI family transcriptional regulator